MNKIHYSVYLQNICLYAKFALHIKNHQVFVAMFLIIP